MKRLIVVMLGGVALVACGVEPAVTCADDSACFEGYRCDSVSAICLRACDGPSDCLASQFCDVPSGETDGVCRQDDGSGNSNNNVNNNGNGTGG